MSAILRVDSPTRAIKHLPSRPPAWVRPAARAFTIVFFIVLAALSAGVLGLGLYASAHSDRIYEGITVAGVPVGGLTQAEAAAAIEQRFAAYADQPLTLTSGDQTFIATPRELGARPDSGRSAGAAFEYGRSGSLWDRSQAWTRGLLEGGSVTPHIVVDRVTLEAKLREIAPAIVRAPIDATVEMNAAGEPLLVPDVPGVGLDLTASQSAIIDRLTKLEAAPVSLVTRIRPAQINVADLETTLPQARAAVGSSLVLRTDEGAWTIGSADLKRIVSAVPGEVRVERSSLEAVIVGIAQEIDREAVDAGITVDEASRLVVAPATSAATVDVPATVEAVVAALLAGTHDVPLVVERAEPAITDAMAADAAERAEAMIRDGMTLTWQGGEARLGRDDLLWALTIVPQPGKEEPFAFGMDEAIVAELLDVVAEGFNEPAVDARFRIVDGKITAVENAKDGRELDTTAGVVAVMDAFGDPNPSAKLEVKTLKPEWTSADIAKIELGDDILGDSSTWYGQSSEPRRQNVERASQLESGWLVPPGGVFSYVENVGDIEQGNGFATGFGIVANEEGGVTTAPVIGGGICQVSTTIFQAAFWAGMPILERYEHPYWLTGYGQPPRGMTGLDAMVNVEEDWALDMKFQNATDNWITVILSADGQNVTAKIVGTDPGWEINVSEPEITNLKPKEEKMVYTDSPELPAGQELQVESAQDGFDVTVRRTVVKDGRTIDDLTLASSYAPARNMTLRGTGTDV